MSGYVKAFKDKGGDRNKKNTLLSLRIEDNNVLEKYKTIWVKIRNLKNIELDAFQVYDDRYITTKIRTYDDKVYTNFRDLNAPEDGLECECFTIISIDSLLVCETIITCSLNNCAYKVVDKQMIDYLDDNLFETDKDQLFYFNNGSYKCYDRIDISESTDLAEINGSKKCMIFPLLVF